MTAVIGFGIIELLFLVPLMLIGVLGTVFWIWMIVDCALHESSTGNDKIVWILVILYTHLIDALLYYFVRRPRRPVGGVS